MTSLKAVKIMLAVLCCFSQAYSCKTNNKSRTYHFGNAQLIPGKHQIDKSTLVYALCESDVDKKTAKCTAKIDSNVFDEEKPKYSCNFSITTQTNQKLEILEIIPWDKDKAIFTWHKINKDDVQHSEVTINTVHWTNCSTTMHKLKVYIRDAMTPEMFIFPSENSYEVAFVDTDPCDNYFCKMTVYGDGKISQVKRWFPNDDLTYALEPMENSSSKLLITVGETMNNMGVAEFYLVNETVSERTILGSYDYAAYLGWSTSNGVISFCTYEVCTQFDYSGAIKEKKVLSLPHNPTEYVALHNLPNGEILTVICDRQPNGNYRVIKIGAEGQEKFSFDLEELKCWQNPEVLISTFFVKSNTDYCLSLFHSVYDSFGEVKFSEYCFSTKDL